MEKCVVCGSKETEYTGISEKRHNFGKKTYHCFACDHTWWEE